MKPTDLQLDCATEYDAEEIAAVYIYSFAEDAHTACHFPRADQKARIKDVADRFPAVLAAPTTHYLKSLDHGNHIVAYSKWKVPEDVKKDLVEQGKIPQSGVASDEVLKRYPVGLNDPFVEDFTEKLRALKTQKHTRRIELSLLGTLPTHRKIGAASAHIDWGIQLCKTYSLPCLVDASQKSASVLRAHGFKEYAKLDTDLGLWGGSDIYTYTCMIWE